MVSALERLAPGFLIAAPSLKDPNFDRTLVLMCVHGDTGAMGLVVNRSTPISVQEIMEQIDVPCAVDLTAKAMMGGPVAMDSGLLLYQCDPDEPDREDEILVTRQLRLCPGKDLLEQIGQGQGPEDFYMFLGHSGWGPGQLEQEISVGAWIPTELNLDLIFSTPVEQRWEEAQRVEGLHPAQMSTFRPQA